MKYLNLLLITLIITISAFTQEAEDTTDWRFHDTLLNHLVGKWNVSGVVHGNKFTLTLEAKWVVNHQWLRIYEKSNENIPGVNVPYESWFYIGYNHSTKKYIAHLLNLFGGDNDIDNLFYGNRTGNSIEFSSKADSNPVDVEQFTWEPKTETWHLTNHQKAAGKNDEFYLDLKAIKSLTN